jgi:hypothetical protein
MRYRVRTEAATAFVFQVEGPRERGAPGFHCTVIITKAITDLGKSFVAVERERENTIGGFARGFLRGFESAGELGGCEVGKFGHRGTPGKADGDVMGGLRRGGPPGCFQFDVFGL